MDFWTYFLLALVVLFGALTIKGTVKFDVNEYMKHRIARKKDRLRRLCPHAIPAYDEKNNIIGVRSLFISPPGTQAYQCQSCGSTTYDRDTLELDIKYWSANIKELISRLQKMEKLSKKLR